MLHLGIICGFFVIFTAVLTLTRHKDNTHLRIIKTFSKYFYANANYPDNTFMSINNRFKEIINKLYAGNQASFAKAIDVSPTVIANVVGKRQGKPSYDVVEKICANANISPSWLLTGEGYMQKSDDEQHSLIPMSSPEGGIPLVPIEAWAGLFHGEEAVALSDCEHFFVPAFKDADFLIPVRGDSMVPRYYSGDLVACKYIPLSDIFFQWGKVYVLDTNQGALIKKVRKGSSNDTITLISENPDYEPFEIPRESIYNIAIVQGLIRTE